MRTIILTLFFLLVGAAHAKDVQDRSYSSKNPIVINWPIAHDPIEYFESVALHFKKELETKTDGRIKINVITDKSNPLAYKVNNLGKSDMTVVRNGEIGMSQVYTDAFVELDPRFYVFDLPFLFKSHEHVNKVVEGKIGKMLMASLENSGLKSLGFTYSGGFLGIASRKQVIKSPEDLKGVKLRNPNYEIGLDIFNLTKVDMVNVLDDDGKRLGVWRSFESGQIEASQVTYNDCLAAFETPSEHKATVLNDTQHAILLSNIVMNKDLFDRLSSEDQKLVVKIGQEVSRMERIKVIEDSRAIVKKLVKAGATVHSLDSKQRSHFSKALSPVYKKYEPIVGKDLIQSIKAAGEELPTGIFLSQGSPAAVD